MKDIPITKYKLAANIKNKGFKLLAFLQELTLLHLGLIFIYTTINANIQQI